MTFQPNEHLIKLERKSKKKDTQGHETWVTTVTEYLPVAWRIYWFRVENPKGKIDSHAVVLDLDKGTAVFETEVEREDGGSARMHGSETVSDWKDYIEKAQTKSLGRALAAVGYGSQFTDDEFAEGERIVDSPVSRAGGNSEGAPSGVPPRSTPNVARLGNRSEAQRDRLSSSLDQPSTQSKPVLDMIMRAQQRAESLQLLWDDVKRDTFGGRCPADETLTVQQVAQINGVLTVVEKGPKSA